MCRKTIQFLKSKMTQIAKALKKRDGLSTLSNQMQNDGYFTTKYFLNSDKTINGIRD